MSALEFGTKFVKLSTQLEEIGLPITAKEKYMSYIEKVGVDMGETIRLDRRQREDENGWWSERLPETWEEAHAVLIERDAVRAGSRVLKEHWSEQANAYPPEDWDQSVGLRGGGIDNGKGKGKGKGKTVCYGMRDKGVCAYGDHCRFSHDPKELAQSRKDKGTEDKRGKILCRFIKNPALGECKHGDKCAYSHDPNKIKEVRQDAGSIGNRQNENDDDSDGWDKPVGIRPSGGIRSVIVTDAEYTEACRALESRVSNQPGPHLPGWRATSLVDPVVEALQAEVAQLKEELATLLKLKAWMPQSCEPSPEPAALANPHKDDPRWSVHNARLQKRTQKRVPQEVQVPKEEQCTAACCAGIINKVMTVSQTCEECTGEPACSIAKKGPKEQSHKEGDVTAPRYPQSREPGLEPAADADCNELPFQSEWKVCLSRKQRRRINKETKQSGKEPREFPPQVKSEPAT